MSQSGQGFPVRRQWSTGHAAQNKGDTAGGVLERGGVPVQVLGGLARAEEEELGLGRPPLAGGHSQRQALPPNRLIVECAQVLERGIFRRQRQTLVAELLGG